MYLALVTFEAIIHESSSLKVKRMAVRGLCDRFFAKFRVPVREVAFQDKWNRAGLAFAIVVGERKNLEKTISGMESFLFEYNDVEVMNVVKSIEKRGFEDIPSRFGGFNGHEH